MKIITAFGHIALSLFFAACSTVSSVAHLRSAVPSLVLKEKTTVSVRTVFGNTVTWSLSDGVYKAVFEDEEGVFYIAEKPVIRISPEGGSLGADSGIYLSKDNGTKVQLAIWYGRVVPAKMKYIDGPLPPLLPEQ